MTTSIHKEVVAVLQAYGLGPAAEILRLEDGLINQTYRVESVSGARYTVQCLNSIFSTELIDDIVAISAHLQKKGANCLQLVQTSLGAHHVETDSGFWRIYHYIEADDFKSELIDRTLYFNVGTLLAELHTHLSTLSYMPKHVLKGFHDADFYISKARTIDRDEYSAKLRDIVPTAIEALELHAHVLTESQQIIHGDPRIENILFLPNNKPHIFIDYDTFMHASRYVDIGDCLRSLLMLESKIPRREQIKLFVNGYNAGNPDAHVSMIQALTSLKYITLELFLRFCIDSVEQCYFMWDHKKYATATEHNEARAMHLWDFYTALQKAL